jgi:hypothetical protein
LLCQQVFFCGLINLLTPRQDPTLSLFLQNTVPQIHQPNNNRLAIAGNVQNVQNVLHIDNDMVSIFYSSRNHLVLHERKLQATRTFSLSSGLSSQAPTTTTKNHNRATLTTPNHDFQPVVPLTDTVIAGRSLRARNIHGRVYSSGWLALAGDRRSPPNGACSPPITCYSFSSFASSIPMPDTDISTGSAGEPQVYGGVFGPRLMASAVPGALPSLKDGGTASTSSGAGLGR